MIDWVAPFAIGSVVVFSSVIAAIFKRLSDIEDELQDLHITVFPDEEETAK